MVKYDKLLEENTILNFTKDYFKLSRVHHEVWYVFHNLPDKYINDFFKILQMRFICPKCRTHLIKYDEKLVQTRMDSIVFHNDVNVRLGKPILSEKGIQEILKGDPDKKFYPDLKPDGIFYCLLMTFADEKYEIFDEIANNLMKWNFDHTCFENLKDFYMFFISSYYLFYKDCFNEENFEKICLEINLLDKITCF